MRLLSSLCKLMQHNNVCKMAYQEPKKNSLHKVYPAYMEGNIKLARCLLLNGDIIALPTDTVYGLACDANNENAIKQLYKIKGRDFDKPVAICVKDIEALRRYGKATHLNDNLLAELLPGPITIVIERTTELSNRYLNPNTTKIGIRIPDFIFIRELCELLHQHPLALTSANFSNEPSSLHINEFKKLWPQLGAVFDAGPIGCTAKQRLASTVVDLGQPGYYKVLRAGIALKQTIEVMHKYGLKCNDS